MATRSSRGPSLPDRNGTLPVAEAARQGLADVLELFEKNGVAIALEGDDAFFAACARANEAEARKLAEIIAYLRRAE
jgi:hypothetical protein